jgi:hypothetical protein
MIVEIRNRGFFKRRNRVVVDDLATDFDIKIFSLISSRFFGG